MSDARLRVKTTGLITVALLTADPAMIRAETPPSIPADIQRAATPAQEGMSVLATKVLHRIVEARAAIHSGESKRAEGELQEALALIERIKAVRPSTSVADHIWVTRKQLDYAEPHEVALSLIPIEISLSDLAEIYSVQRAERYLKETKTHLDRGDTEAARRELAQLKDSLAQTEVDLPLTSTEQHVGTAFAELAEGRLEEADQALQNAEAGVRFVSLGNSAPLAKSRRALWQAMENYAAGHHDAVAADLTRALDWLEKVKAHNDPETRREAQRLHTDIDELLKIEAHRTPDAESELAGFWHRSMGLVERQAEKLYHAWRDQQTENHIYGQLVNAKMHLYYAEHELFSGGDTDDATRELERATAYLQAAATDATGDRKAQIEALRAEVTDLTALAANPNKKMRARYDAVMLELRGMLHEI